MERSHEPNSERSAYNQKTNLNEISIVNLIGIILELLKASDAERIENLIVSQGVLNVGVIW